MRTYWRWKMPGGAQDRRKEGATKRAVAWALSPEEQATVSRVLASREFRSAPPEQVHAVLADRGIVVCSPSTMRRLLRAKGMAKRRDGARTPVPKPKGLCAAAPNRVWSWDITLLLTTIAGVFFKLYLVIDIYSRKIVGAAVHENESGELASQLIAKACAVHGVEPGELVLHADNGPAMKASSLYATLRRLGVRPSHSRPGECNENAFSESLFRTLKHSNIYPTKPFDTVAEAREWVARFVNYYNTEHRHSSIGYVTPHQRHNGEDAAILEKRRKAIIAKMHEHPGRWRQGKPMRCKLARESWLNPSKRREEREAKAKAREPNDEG